MDAYVAIWNVVTPIGCGHSSSMTHGMQTFSADVFILKSPWIRIKFTSLLIVINFGLILARL